MTENATEERDRCRKVFKLESGTPYWYLSSIESLGTERDNSSMAIETLERLQSGGSQITFPSIWTDFRFGHHAWRLGSAPDTKRFSITWHQEKICLDE